MEDKIVISTIPPLPNDGPEGIQAVHQAAEKGEEAAKTGPGGEIGSPEPVRVQITLKKKRGRLRKYDHLVEKTTRLANPPSGFASPLSVTCEKSPRGRPRGSGSLQILASLGGYLAETAGGNFTPHVITVGTGEDLVSKLLAFTQKGYKAVCILSATGAVSSVIIRQPGSSGGILRYEGRFEILTLTGSFTFGQTTGMHRKTGVLSVSLAKPDGRVFGGGVLGPLIASGPIQLIVGSFRQNIMKKLRQKRQSAESSTAACLVNGTSDDQTVRINSSSQIDQENCTTPTSAVLMEEPTVNNAPLNQEAADHGVKSDHDDVNDDDDDGDDQINSFQISDEINTISISQI